MDQPKTAMLDELKELYNVELVSKGPTDKGWEGNSLRCPNCKLVLSKAWDHECECGNLFLDAGMFRVSIRDGNESDVEVYSVTKHENKNET